MNRGATAYGLRGVGLAFPNGTLDNPSMRFGRERSGFFRVADGRWGLGIKRFRAVEVSQGDLFIRSNTPGAGLVAPLAMARVNPTTADGQETAFDTYEGTAPIGRIASYRHASGRFGWKFYAGDAGLLVGTPALGLSPDNDGTIGRDFVVGRHLGVGGPAIAGSAVAAYLPTGGSGYLQGSTSSHFLSLSNAVPGTTPTNQLVVGLAVGGPGYLGLVNDVSIYTTGSAGGRMLLGARDTPRIVIDQVTRGVEILGVNGAERFRVANDGVLSHLGGFSNRMQDGAGEHVVRHSATNAALFRVTDAGIEGSFPIAAGSITSTMILNGTIAAVDMAPGVIQPRTATLVVASSTASAASRAAADYVCDGVADQVEINAALAALPAIGGTVYLTEGNYVLTAPIVTSKANSHLVGAGLESTYLAVVNAAGAAVNTYLTQMGHSGCSVEDLTIDGNKANNAAQTGMWGVALLANLCYARNVRVAQSPGAGFITVDTATKPRLIGCVADGCAQGGMFVRSHTPQVAQVIHCVVNSNGVYGFQTDIGPAQYFGCIAAAQNSAAGFINSAADVVYEDCTAIGNTSSGFGLSGARTKATGCSSRSNGADGFAVTAGDCQIQSCTSNNNAGNGISGTAGSGGTLVSGCLVYQNTQSGITTGASALWLIEGNRVTTNGQFGINAGGSNQAINGNQVFLSGAHGIACSAPASVITNNHVYASSQLNHNTYFGISGPGAGTHVAGNTCRQGGQANKPAYGTVLNDANILLGINDFSDSGVQGGMTLLGGATGIKRPGNELLNYAPLTDLLNGTAITAGTWLNVFADQTFTVASTNSLVGFFLTGNMIGQLGSASGQFITRLWIDNAQEVKISGGSAPIAQQAGPLLTGTYWIGTLAAGAHTVRVQITANAAGASVYLRGALTPYEFVRLQIMEYIR